MMPATLLCAHWTAKVSGMTTIASTDATMSPEMIESMRPIWAEAYEALRTDMGTLEDLARAAARAPAARESGT